MKAHNLSPNEEITAEGVYNEELIIDIDVTNNSAAPIDVFLQRYELDMVSGAQSAICWGGLCYPPNVSLSPSATTVGAGQTVEAECQLHYYPNGFPGVSTISYTFFDGANVNDSVSFIVHFDGLMTSIEVNYGIEAQAYPNPANDYFTLKFDQEVEAGSTVEIINTIGSVIAEQPVSGNETRLNTTTLAEGIYFYRLRNNQTVNTTGRIIVKH